MKICVSPAVSGFTTSGFCNTFSSSSQKSIWWFQVGGEERDREQAHQQRGHYDASGNAPRGAGLMTAWQWRELLIE